MKIYFYESNLKTSFAKSPIKKFIGSLNKIDQARFFEVFDEIETHGFSAVRVIFKPIEGKLWEIKFNSSQAGYRIFYCLIEREKMVWLHAFSKKAAKTPLKELKSQENV